MRRLIPEVPMIGEPPLVRDWKRNLTAAVNNLDRTIRCDGAISGIGNTAGVVTTLFLTTLPLNYFNTPGESLDLVCSGYFSDSASTNKELTIDIPGPSLIVNGASFAGTQYEFEARASILFIEEDIAVNSISFISSNPSVPVAVRSVAFDPGDGPYVLGISGFGTNANDVVCNGWRVSAKGREFKSPDTVVFSL